MNNSIPQMFDEILSFKRSSQPNYYELLGCSPLSSEEQISKEYKIRALQLHPDKRDGQQTTEFERLQKARETLLNSKSRGLYDRWISSGLAIDFEQFAVRFKDNCSGFHWMSHRSEPMITFDHKTLDHDTAPPSSIASNASSPKLSEWSRDTTTDLVNKFRNYEI